MAKTDRSILLSNDQAFGQIADPNKLESSITHAYDKIDQNDTEFINHKSSPDHDGRYYTKTETEGKLAFKTDNTGNHKGTWQGLNPSDFDSGQQAIDLATHKADDIQHVKYGAATGTANTYAVTLNPAPIAYVEGMAVAFKVPVASTAASTLNVNGLGDKGIKKANGTDVTNLKAGGIYTVRYDGTAFILQGEGGSGNLQPSQALAGYTFTNDDGEQIGTGDPDLIPTNIRQGVNVFGVDGTLVEGIKYNPSTDDLGQTLKANSFTNANFDRVIIDGGYYEFSVTIGQTKVVRKKYNNSNTLLETLDIFTGLPSSNYDTCCVIDKNRIMVHNSANSAAYPLILDFNGNILFNGLSIGTGLTGCVFIAFFEDTTIFAYSYGSVGIRIVNSSHTILQTIPSNINESGAYREVKKIHNDVFIALTYGNLTAIQRKDGTYYVAEQVLTNTGGDGVVAFNAMCSFLLGKGI